MLSVELKLDGSLISFVYCFQVLMSCTPPRTPSPGSLTSMPVSVIMIGKRDGTAEPVGSPRSDDSSKQDDYEGERVLPHGRQVFFVENKNTDRHLRNANFGMEQIFVANKDTNREDAESSKQHSSSSIVRPINQFAINNAPVPDVMPGSCQVVLLSESKR